MSVGTGKTDFAFGGFLEYLFEFFFFLFVCLSYHLSVTYHSAPFLYALQVDTLSHSCSIENFHPLMASVGI